MVNRVGSRNCVLDRYAHWCHLANMVERLCLQWLWVDLSSGLAVRPVSKWVWTVCVVIITIIMSESCVMEFVYVLLLLWCQNKEKPLSKLLQRGEDVVFDQVSQSPQLPVFHLLTYLLSSFHLHCFSTDQKRLAGKIVPSMTYYLVVCGTLNVNSFTTLSGKNLWKLSHLVSLCGTWRFNSPVKCCCVRCVASCWAC